MRDLGVLKPPPPRDAFEVVCNRREYQTTVLETEQMTSCMQDWLAEN